MDNQRPSSEGAPSPYPHAQPVPSPFGGHASDRQQQLGQQQQGQQQPVLTSPPAAPLPAEGMRRPELPVLESGELPSALVPSKTPRTQVLESEGAEGLSRCVSGGDEANVLCGFTAVVAHATCLGPCPIHVYPWPPAATTATGDAADAACHCCCWCLLLVCLQGALRTLESGELQLSLRPSGLASLQLPQHQQGKEAPAAPAGSAGQPGSLAAAASAPLKVDSQAPVDLAEVLVRAANAAAAEAEASGSGRRSDPHRYAWHCSRCISCRQLGGDGVVAVGAHPGLSGA